MMKNLFEQSRSHWVRYDHYELKTAEDGKRYITPGKSAKPDVYNPLKEVPNIVLDALNVGMLMMGRKPEAEVEKAIMEFVTRYGLLGLMTALPTTPSFMDYEAVYLPKNHFIKEESMATDKYLSLFYPFDQLDLVKKGITSTWNVSGDRNLFEKRLNPKFCVNSQRGENRPEFNVCGSGSIRLPPCAQYNAGGDGCQGRRQGRRSSERRAAARRPLTSGPGGVIRACVRQNRWTTARGSRSSPAAVPSTSS